MRILVTGASGMIGTRLCERLAKEGFDCLGVDIRENRWNKDIKTIILDLRKRSEMKRLPKVDLVIHLAANPRVFNLVVDPAQALDNFGMVFNVLEYMRLGGAGKIMFSSSREVYGNTDKDMLSEEDFYIGNCESPYSATKIGGEALIHAYARCYGIDFVIFRFSNVYGMYDDSDRIVPNFIRLCRDGKKMTIYGPEKIFDFTYIDDIVDGMMLAIRGKSRNEVFNLSFGKGVSIISLARLVKDTLKSSSEIEAKETRKGEVIRYVADISKAREILGFSPKVGIEEGIRKAIGWIRYQS